MSGFAGRTALVTGGSRGIGAAVATRLASAGARVIVTGRDADVAHEHARAIGGESLAFDVADPDAVAAAFAQVGPVDVLVCNAGVDQHAFHTDTTPADWRALLGVNLESVFACTRAALPAMQQAGYGRIVCVTSEAGRIGSKGGAVYAAAKAGVVGFAKSLARENARFGITVNVVAPGPIETPLLQTALDDAGDNADRLADAMRNGTLLRRFGSADEVAAAVVFLASEEAGYITAETLGVSGGMGLGA